LFRTRFGCAYPDQFLSWSARGCGGTWAKLGYAIAIGFASGYVATGTFRRGVIGAFSAGITMGIANAGNLSAWQRVGLQATTGGVVESLSGGKFGHGFVSAGVTASVMPQVGHIGNDAARTVVGALVGGTLSKATGGKFANGAISGAIQGAMAKSARKTNSGGGKAPEDLRRGAAAIRAAQDALVESGFYSNVAKNLYGTESEIAEAWGKAVLPVTESYKVEIGAYIARHPSGAWSVGAPWSNGAFDWVRPADALLPKFEATAWVHTHPMVAGGENLSGGDVHLRNVYGELKGATHEFDGDVPWAINEGMNIYSYGGLTPRLSSFNVKDALNASPTYACYVMVPKCL
jgi:hypothetical protein